MTHSAIQSNNLVDYASAVTRMDFQSTANLSLRTEEGDVVNLSVNHQRHYSESVGRARGADGSTIQEFSAEATAMSNYSLSIQGSLNDEEMSSILQLVKKIGPLMREFLGGAGPIQDGGMTSAIGLPEEIESFRLSMEKTAMVATSASASYVSKNDPENQGVRDVQALISAALDSVFMSMVSDKEYSDPGVLKKLSDLLTFIYPPTSSQN